MNTLALQSITSIMTRRLDEYDRGAQLDGYEDLLDARKAQSLAAWSYVGLVIPLLGWILAGMSLSASAGLPENGKLGRKRERARMSAKLSIFLSLIAALIYVAIIIHANSVRSQQNAAQAAQAVQQQQQDAAQTDVQSCIDQAHQQWDSEIAIAEGTPGNAASFDQSMLDQQIATCKY
jgi:uncharacterized membrane protein